MDNRTPVIVSELDAQEESGTGTDADRVRVEPSPGFVYTSQVRELTERALAYLDAGYPVHLSGPAGTGKTTLAFHIAAQLGRPVTLIHGDDELGSSDLIGQNSGFHKAKIVDNYVRSVWRTEEELTQSWKDNRLTVACRHGYTLIYDEFTRSRPEANNALLSVLEERFLNLPRVPRRSDGYVEVHPHFRAIFTSNPKEYAGVHKTQDALLDRLVTIRLDHLDRATEIEITRARSGVSTSVATGVVDIVRTLREMAKNPNRPTIRACIAISRVLAGRGGAGREAEPFFLQVFHDVLNMEGAHQTDGSETFTREQVDELVRTTFSIGKSEPAEEGAKKKQINTENGGG